MLYYSACSRSRVLALPASIRSILRHHLVSRQYSGAASHSSLTIGNKTYPSDSWTNAPQSIIAQYDRRLHVQPNHPLSITRKLIESCFPGFQHHNDLPGVVSVNQNFDSLGFAPDHPGRARSDTYYINKDTLFRTHTSAHEVDVFRANTSDGYTISALQQISCSASRCRFLASEGWTSRGRDASDDLVCTIASGRQRNRTNA